ncbi:MAG TPA: hypothetical protein VHB02_02890 [Acidimicrobiales bacterium]|nr:hypothetical protein [Acidimicrobiales bacterium]
MELVVDLQAGTVDLTDPDDFAHFAVRVSGPAEPAGGADRLAAVLADTEVGRLEGGADAFILPDAVRSLAAGRAGEGWEDGFAGMCRYAATKGWVADDGGIQAHVEWPPAGP